VYLSDLMLEILQTLRHGPLDLFQISADANSAPWIVRAELKGLKGQQLIREEFTGHGRVWRLTERGSAIAWAAFQEMLDPPPDLPAAVERRLREAI
jgi:predicted transcriptional regulator